MMTMDIKEMLNKMKGRNTKKLNINFNVSKLNLNKNSFPKLNIGMNRNTPLRMNISNSLNKNTSNILKGAPLFKQRQWKNMTLPQKTLKRCIYPDYDRDGVPNRWDCQPMNPLRQDSKNIKSKAIQMSGWACPECGTLYNEKDDAYKCCHSEDEFTQESGFQCPKCGTLYNEKEDADECYICKGYDD